MARARHASRYASSAGAPTPKTWCRRRGSTRSSSSPGSGRGACDRFVAWLLGIVVNLAKSRLRARGETPVDDWAGGRAIREFVWMDDEPTPDTRQEARELHDCIWSALGTLPPEQQETVQLH